MLSKRLSARRLLQLSNVSYFSSAGWHSDVPFDLVPSDYAMLMIILCHQQMVTPSVASQDLIFRSLADGHWLVLGIGVRDLPSIDSGNAEVFRGLKATHDATFFLDEAEQLGNPIRKGIRGSPLNKGSSLKADHPIMRTNREYLPSSPKIDQVSFLETAVPGLRSMYVNKGFTRRINSVTEDESDLLLGYLFNLVTQSHDAQIRFS